MKRLLLLPLLLSACTPLLPGLTPKPTGTPAASGSPAATTGGTLAYAGMTLDKVSAAIAGGADGKKDHVFTYNYSFASEAAIKEVTLSRVENGKPLGFAGWTTSPARAYWLLKVLTNGVELNGNAKGSSVGKLEGAIKFQLVGADNAGQGLSKPGTIYELMLIYNDGGADKTLTQRVTI